MESWPAYEKFAMRTSIIMDQITQNAVITTARIGIMQVPCLPHIILHTRQA